MRDYDFDPGPNVDAEFEGVPADVADVADDVASSWVDIAAALTADIENADSGGREARFARGDHWLGIERAAGSEEPAAEIAAELNISHKTYLQERHVSRMWTKAERIYRLTWSHYRAAAYCDDRTIAADVMADAERGGWSEARVGREVAARSKGQPGEDDAPMPNPDDFDNAAGYIVAMLVRDGMREAKAARLVGDVLRLEREWIGDDVLENVFGQLAPDVEFVDAGERVA